MLEVNPTPELAHFACHLLPHLAGSHFWGIEEPLYQAGFSSLLGSVRATERTRHRICKCFGNGQTLDTLRAPLCRDLAAGYAPNLLRIVLEEGSIESIAKTIHEKILQGSFRSNMRHSSATITPADFVCLEDPNLLERICAQFQGVIEEAAPVEDARQSPSHQHDRIGRCGWAGSRYELYRLSLVGRAERGAVGSIWFSPTGKISCHQRMTQSDFEKNR